MNKKQKRHLGIIVNELPDAINKIINGDVPSTWYNLSDDQRMELYTTGDLKQYKTHKRNCVYVNEIIDLLELNDVKHIKTIIPRWDKTPLLRDYIACILLYHGWQRRGCYVNGYIATSMYKYKLQRVYIPNPILELISVEDYYRILGEALEDKDIPISLEDIVEIMYPKICDIIQIHEYIDRRLLKSLTNQILMKLGCSVKGIYRATPRKAQIIKDFKNRARWYEML